MKKFFIALLASVSLLAGTATSVLANAPGLQNETVKVVTTSSLRVRTAPNTSSSVIGHLQKGASVTVISDNSNGWSTIYYNGGTGYVSTQYIKDPNAPIPDGKTVESTMYVIDNVNVRAGASMEYPSLGHLTRGDTVSVLGSDPSGNWKEIHYFGGVGYVANNHLSSISPTDTTTTNYPIYQIKGATHVNIRSGPSTAYAAYAYMVSGQRVEVISIANGWAKVPYNGGYGYIAMQYLVKV